MNIDADELEIQYGIQTLEDEMFVSDAGLVDEAMVSVHVALDGGKKKKKRKPHTTPKKIKHVHKKRPKALLEYFSVDDSTGKVKRLKQESPNLPGVYMADHPDRFTCGRTGTMFYKLTADGKRLPIPKQNKPVAAAKVEKVAAKKDDKKKKKK
jgi:small subunit ribosomal protein S27Ae